MTMLEQPGDHFIDRCVRSPRQPSRERLPLPFPLPGSDSSESLRPSSVGALRWRARSSLGWRIQCSADDEHAIIMSRRAWPSEAGV